MKKIAVLLLLTVITLSGCQEPHEHEWVEATCETAKYCSTCEKTEGEALGHKNSEVNYQTPATCSVCGEVEGSVLEPDFVKYNLEIKGMVDVTYDYYTCGNGEPDVEILGELTFHDYAVFASDETHTAKDGFEWRSVKVDLLFTDRNVLTHGAEWSTTWEDYYTIDKHDSTADVVDEEGTTYSFTVNYNGVDYEDCLFVKNLSHSGWDGNNYLVTYEFSFQVPVGYDGCVIAFYHGATEWAEDQHIYDIADENTIFFRLN